MLAAIVIAVLFVVLIIVAEVLILIFVFHVLQNFVADDTYSFCSVFVLADGSSHLHVLIEKIKKLFT